MIQSKFFSFILALIFSLSIQSVQSQNIDESKEYNIAAIRVEGEETLNKTLVIALSNLSVGETIKVPGIKISQAIKLLWKQELFSDIDIIQERVQGNNIFLLIKVVEKPRLRKYKISGIKKNEIKDIKSNLELRAGIILNEQIIAKIHNVIRNYYKEKGYIHPKISITKTKDEEVANSVKLDINIDRGYRYKVGDVVFLGNDVAAASKLRSAMKENKAEAKVNLFEMLKFKKHLDNPGWTWYDYLGSITPSNMKKYTSEFIRPNIFNAAKYKPEELNQADKKSIKSYYSSIGYRDAKVVADTIIERKNHKVDIFLKVDEGRKYFFRNISWIGNTKYSDTVLNRILDIRKGDVYNSEKLEQRLRQNPQGSDVSALYMDDGYLFFNVEPLEVAIDGDSVDYLMRIHEGSQATINRVNISGNAKTNEHVVRRELRLKPGDKFSRSQLIRTQRELGAMGYFDLQNTQILPKPNNDGTVDIDLILEEKPNDQLSLSLGYANQFYGQVGMNFTNFSIRNLFKFKYWDPLPSGDGQRFSVNIQSSGIRSQLYNVSFTEPWLGGKRPISLTLSGSHRRFNQTLDGRTSTGSFITNIFSAELGSRLKWPDDYFVAFFGLTYQSNILDNYSFSPEINNGTINNVFGRFTLTRNSLNGPIGPQIYPTTGSNISFSVQATLPYSLMFDSRELDYENLTDFSKRWNWIEYHKWKFSADMYMPIVGNLVARMTYRFGTLGYYNSAYGISPFEKFRIGGDGLVGWNQFGQETYALRGYNDNEVTVDENGRFYSSSTLFSKYVMELRYPIMLSQQSSVYAMLFGEAGNGWERFRDFDPFNVKRSYGAGVRFFLPMFGLLGFDYGLGVDKYVPPSLQNENIFNKYGKFRFILSFEPQ